MHHPRSQQYIIFELMTRYFEGEEFNLVDRHLFVGSLFIIGQSCLCKHLKNDIRMPCSVSENILIQFLTLRKLCSFVRSNRRRKPIASLKNAVVKLLNLETARVEKADEQKVSLVQKRGNCLSFVRTSPALQCPTAAYGSSVLCLMIHQHLMICKPECNRGGRGGSECRGFSFTSTAVLWNNVSRQYFRC